MYKIEVYPDAQDQMAGLSTVAQNKLSEALEVIELVPLNSLPVSEQNPDGALRQFLFGHSVPAWSLTLCLRISWKCMWSR